MYRSYRDLTFLRLFLEISGTNEGAVGKIRHTQIWQFHNIRFPRKSHERVISTYSREAITMQDTEQNQFHNSNQSPTLRHFTICLFSEQQHIPSIFIRKCAIQQIMILISSSKFWVTRKTKQRLSVNGWENSQLPTRLWVYIKKVSIRSIKVTQEHAMKAQRGKRGIALPFL
jgi:hypothetical protein